MKLELEKKKLNNGATLYFEGSRTIYCNFPGEEYVKECKPQYKIAFHPEKIGRVPDLEHEAFVKCLMNSFKEGSLTKAELDRRIRRGRPITVSTKPIMKKTTKRVPLDIDAIIANVLDLTKTTASYVDLVEDEANPFPYIIKEAASARTEKAEESS
eukprot:7377980-Prymnesium_polylepis.1